MLCFPNAKINIGLNITSKRADGYHNLETVFYPVKIKDALEIIPADSLKFTYSGLKIPGDYHNNLCLKAYELLRRDHFLPPLHIHLHKNIPIGAGTGGGSANAAFLIVQLNTQFKLGLTVSEMEALAAKLGADCPFFIQNKPVFATARGDKLEDCFLDLSSYFVVLAMPDIHVSTADAFSGVVPGQPATSLKELVKRPVSTWKHTIINDFEKTVFSKFPKVAAIKQQLYDHGALYASMSGSGSSVYALFESQVKLPDQEDGVLVFYDI